MDAAPLRAKRRKMAESSTLLKDLPDDLLVEILIRIPDLKRLFQYKSVCKLWCSLISSTDFRCRYISLHSSMNRNLPFNFLGYVSVRPNPRLIFPSEPIFQSPGFSFDFLPSCHSSTIRIIETSYDLVLCYDSDNLSTQMVYYICNPLTMQWKALPPAPYSSEFENLCFCFIRELHYKEDPLQEHYGIAVNTQQIQRFKFVRIIHGALIYLGIFSFETGQWNQTVLSIPGSILKRIYEVVACKDGMKLILLGMDHYCGLVSITFGGENFDKCDGIRTILPPGHCRYMCGLTLCKRTLRMAYIVCSQRLQILELGEYEEWKLVQNDSIGDRKIIKLLHRYCMNSQPDPFALGFHPHERDVLLINIGYNGGVLSYNMQERTLNLVPNDCPEAEYFLPFFHPLVLPSWPTPIP